MKRINKSALDKIAVANDLEKAEMYAILKALCDDQNALIHKLEIRLKANGKYRTVCRVTKAK